MKPDKDPKVIKILGMPIFDNKASTAEFKKNLLEKMRSLSSEDKAKVFTVMTAKGLTAVPVFTNEHKAELREIVNLMSPDDAVIVPASTGAPLTVPKGGRSSDPSMETGRGRGKNASTATKKPVVDSKGTLTGAAKDKVPDKDAIKEGSEKKKTAVELLAEDVEKYNVFLESLSDFVFANRKKLGFVNGEEKTKDTIKKLKAVNQVSLQSGGLRNAIKELKVASPGDEEAAVLKKKIEKQIVNLKKQMNGAVQTDFADRSDSFKEEFQERTVDQMLEQIERLRKGVPAGGDTDKYSGYKGLDMVKAEINASEDKIPGRVNERHFVAIARLGQLKKRLERYKGKDLNEADYEVLHNIRRDIARYITEFRDEVLKLHDGSPEPDPVNPEPDTGGPKEYEKLLVIRNDWKAKKKTWEDLLQKSLENTDEAGTVANPVELEKAEKEYLVTRRRYAQAREFSLVQYIRRDEIHDSAGDVSLERWKEKKTLHEDAQKKSKENPGNAQFIKELGEAKKAYDDATESSAQALGDIFVAREKTADTAGAAKVDIEEKFKARLAELLILEPMNKKLEAEKATLPENKKATFGNIFEKLKDGIGRHRGKIKLAGYGILTGMAITGGVVGVAAFLLTKKAVALAGLGAASGVTAAGAGAVRTGSMVGLGAIGGAAAAGFLYQRVIANKIEKKLVSAVDALQTKFESSSFDEMEQDYYENSKKYANAEHNKQMAVVGGALVGGLLGLAASSDFAGAADSVVAGIDGSAAGASVNPEALADVGMSTAEAPLIPSAEVESEIVMETKYELQSRDVREMVPVANEQQILVVPEEYTGTDTLSETMFEAFKAGSIDGLPDDMTNQEFLSGMYAAIEDLEGNTEVLDRMSVDGSRSLERFDLVFKDSGYNIQPIIEHMNGDSIDQIASGTHDDWVTRTVTERVSVEVPVGSVQAPEVNVSPEAVTTVGGAEASYTPTHESVVGTTSVSGAVSPEAVSATSAAETIVTPTPEVSVETADTGLGALDIDADVSTAEGVLLSPEQAAQRLAEGFENQAAVYQFMTELGMENFDLRFNAPDGIIVSGTPLENYGALFPGLDTVQGDINLIYMNGPNLATINGSDLSGLGGLDASLESVATSGATEIVFDGDKITVTDATGSRVYQKDVNFSQSGGDASFSAGPNESVSFTRTPEDTSVFESISGASAELSAQGFTDSRIAEIASELQNRSAESMTSSENLALLNEITQREILTSRLDGISGVASEGGLKSLFDLDSSAIKNAIEQNTLASVLQNTGVQNVDFYTPILENMNAMGLLDANTNFSTALEQAVSSNQLEISRGLMGQESMRIGPSGVFNSSKTINF